MKDRPDDPYWYRFRVGDRVEGDPDSFQLLRERGTVMGYHDSNNVLCYVQFDNALLNGGELSRPVVVSLLKPLGVIDRLGELSG